MTTTMTTTLYHGTDSATAKKIRKSGFRAGLVYLTNDWDAAARYGGPDAVVLTVNVPTAEILIDFDLGGDRVIDVAGANAYREEERDIHEWLATHGAFAVRAKFARLV